MAELSRFFGIIIRMFAEAGERHHTPHFHAVYQEHTAVCGITPVQLVSGFLPTKQRRLVEAWAEIHEAELMADWELLQGGMRPDPIEPLR